MTRVTGHQKMPGASQTQGAPALNCPGCGTKVTDGTSICPSCDYIIDASFISTDAPQDSGDEAEAGPPPPRRKTASRPTVRNTTGTGARPRVPHSTGARPTAPVLADEDATNIRPMEEILRNAPQRPTGGRPGGRDVTGTNTGTGQIVAPEQALEDLRDFVGMLGRSDKIAFAGGVTLLISAFLPWKETADEGEILGLMSLGLVAVMGAIGVIGSIAVRVRRLMPHLNVLIPWLAQLGLSVFCILWCIIFMKVSYDATEVPSPMGKATLMSSSPSFGVFLGLLGALTSLAGSLLGLKEKPAS
ncbi:hypothetical protein [Archangium sp.]|uniref:hypothetical protein n=1 Tax=Archangium sp. TaxID=1872627 RepID=UPI002D3B6989|nr:hypothetical protein [Archangium sp.]HYO59744.1 hypothetical protein [Archangium sp.]